MKLKEAPYGMHSYCCRVISFPAQRVFDIFSSKLYVPRYSYTFLYTPRSFCQALLKSHTFLYVLCKTYMILWSCHTFPYVRYTFGIRSSMILLNLVGKLYVSIRSVQPFRDSVKMLYVFIRSVYVRHTFLNVFVKFCWKVVRFHTFCATLPWFCEIVIRFYTFGIRSVYVPQWFC